MSDDDNFWPFGKPISRRMKRHHFSYYLEGHWNQTLCRIGFVRKKEALAWARPRRQISIWRLETDERESKLKLVMLRRHDTIYSENY